jgi:hypothetical protein
MRELHQAFAGGCTQQSTRKAEKQICLLGDLQQRLNETCDQGPEHKLG